MRRLYLRDVLSPRFFNSIFVLIKLRFVAFCKKARHAVQLHNLHLDSGEKVQSPLEICPNLGIPN